MNINKINTQIKYGDLEKILKDKIDFDCFDNFNKLAIKNNLYSDFDFIDYFSKVFILNNIDNDVTSWDSVWFWKNVLIYSNISIITLIKKYKKYFMNEQVFNMLQFQLTHIPLGKNEIERIKQYCKIIIK